jgi:hypothetical protein
MADIFKFSIIEPVEIDTMKHGDFHSMYNIELIDEAKEELILGEWLSYNCSDNFTFTKISDTLFAGGSTDNACSWRMRLRERYFSTVTTYKLKLSSKEDAILFELTWLA